MMAGMTAGRDHPPWPGGWAISASRTSSSASWPCARSRDVPAMRAIGMELDGGGADRRGGDGLVGAAYVARTGAPSADPETVFILLAAFCSIR